MRATSTTVAEPSRALPDSVGLAEFLAAVEADPLPLADRHRLVAAARVLLEELYVHLPLKRAMHATDPLQRLRLLERRLAPLSELQFHAELTDVFRSLRDLHTVYQLPDPYRGHVATLGFLVERYSDPDGTPHHIVSKIDPSLVHAGLDVGAEIEAWNGVPIERAVERHAAAQAGSHADARLARGLESLTLRPLRTTPPPRRAPGAPDVPHQGGTPPRDPGAMAGAGRRTARGAGAGPRAHAGDEPRHRPRWRGRAPGQAVAVRAAPGPALGRPGPAQCRRPPDAAHPRPLVRVRAGVLVQRGGRAALRRADGADRGGRPGRRAHRRRPRQSGRARPGRGVGPAGPERPPGHSGELLAVHRARRARP
ncbi:hypothetical protein RB200_29520 [Streptomyces sp. PmtG]